MTRLAALLAQRIASTGPMTIADYMAECLLHPQFGYYATRDPFGAAGDFTTAPEISQMFGEMVGLCLAQCWLDQDRPAQICLCELGPGRGTLMADIVRATRAVPGFADAVQIHLVEASPTLREIQRKTLEPATPIWHDTLSTLPDLPLYLVANEFFDALPIRQFQRAGKGWSEHVVALKAGVLTLSLVPPIPVGALTHRLTDTQDGDVVEICPASTPVMAEVSRRIGTCGGAALVIDYGGWHSLGDTFQALRAHKPVNPLAEPGDADLTAHVDFEALAHAARNSGHRVQVTGMTPQGAFLERLGITERANALAGGLSGSALANHVSAHRRLTHPEEMGTLFKVIGLHPENVPAPTGLTI